MAIPNQNPYAPPPPEFYRQPWQYRWFASWNAPDPTWWTIPAVTTPLAVVLGYSDYALVEPPWQLCSGYLIAAALCLASWLFPRTRQHRTSRLGFGISACLVAFFYGKALSFFTFGLAIVAWLAHGD
ncbi:hypothetical protein QIS99_24375 [Streptomyces sp. B-S-A8]|uniref:Uncharacterized protein n=1 Tax=Streptomyces solicavernae TaxID=3043614 RepID=A0ABT6RXZ3_9ACTN|nr:hypothetical protein [Streptomyces sp. B-S-A8]MDI3389311.1 hypothetical protein [Streptomyces sp. B-S-A8]